MGLCQSALQLPRAKPRLRHMLETGCLVWTSVSFQLWDTVAQDSSNVFQTCFIKQWFAVYNHLLILLSVYISVLFVSLSVCLSTVSLSIIMYSIYFDAHSPQEMLMVVSRVMSAGAWAIKGIAMDGHHAHRYLKECLLGVFEKLDPAALSEMPFFKDLKYQDMPKHVLPRLPVRLCLYEDETVWCLGGPCHSSKNAAGGLTSPLRTICLGKYFCDTSNARKWGLPPAVFRRAEPMSDKLNALLFNPYYAISSSESCLLLQYMRFSVDIPRIS